MANIAPTGGPSDQSECRVQLLLLFTGSSRPQLLALVAGPQHDRLQARSAMDFPLLGMSFVAFIATRIKIISGRDVPLVEPWTA